MRMRCAPQYIPDAETPLIITALQHQSAQRYYFYLTKYVVLKKKC